MQEKVLSVLSITIFTFLVTGPVALAGWKPNEKSEMISKANDTIAAFKKADSEMEGFFKQAYGYAVYPTIGKGAIGIGGASGKGVVYQGGTPVAGSRMTQVTIGFQLGGQTYSEIVFFENKDAFDRFAAEKLEFSAQASAVAATAGAAATADYEGGVAVFTMAKGGLMYEASIGGQNFSYNAF
jgi:lipid-binding SYLF domain-containing protein